MPCGPWVLHLKFEPKRPCTPASGWEKGQVENQVQFLRGELFCPRLAFDDRDALNAWLHLRCEPKFDSKSRKIASCDFSSPYFSMSYCPERSRSGGFLL